MGMNVRETMSSPHVWHPHTAEEAWQFKQTYGTESVYAAGVTLLRTQWETGTAPVPLHLINLSGISGLNDIRVGESGLIVGSLTTLQACRTHALLQRSFPMVTEAVRQVAAPSVRNQATIGGNVASLVGDSITALLAYDAALVWYSGAGTQQEELSDWLQAAMQPGYRNDRLLLHIKLPFQVRQDDMNAKTRRFCAYHKIGRREAFTPSVVTAAVSGWLSGAGTIDAIQIAAGGGQTVPRRLIEAEREIIGLPVDEQLLTHLYERMMTLYAPREDVFASAAYRKQTAANVIVTELWKAASSVT
ncbi:FAD binding domain-containing protein [Paenibacillus harenae]|uniref:FAD binding domain-containing protein n=1 Tax=Paenibacillus harenae TaxID=306543 RepID=UPI0003F5C515|nr:FAD binding domain-containing protein [Paenibacillus harenae]